MSKGRSSDFLSLYVFVYDLVHNQVFTNMTSDDQLVNRLARAVSKVGGIIGDFR